MDNDRAPRTLLEQLIRDSDHTLEEVCAQFDKAAREADTGATLSVRQLQRWMAGEVDSARPPARRVAARLWAKPFHTLLGPPENGLDTRVPLSPVVDETLTGAPYGRNRHEVAATAVAHESMQHAVAVSGSVDLVTIEQVQAEAWRLARAYTAMTPMAVLGEARRARDLTYLLLDQTRRPNQTRDLYLVAGQLCGLMAAASFDLAAWDATAEQARAAYLYGELIDHPGLRAWTRGHQALLAYWTGRPQHAVTLAKAGLTEAPTGSPRARLHGIVARAWSHVGNQTETRAAIAAADDAREGPQGHDDLHDEVAGEFGWGPSRHSACIGSALVQIGDGHGAADRIATALALHPTDQHGGLLAERAHCDLANAELLRRDLDAASHALEPVWQLPAPNRSEGVTGRLIKAERMLVNKQWQRDRQAAGIREQIVLFNAQASARALPAAAT
jgi:hypothetical protein